MATDPTRITVLVAGTNEPSNSATLAVSFVEGIQRVKDVSVTVLRLKDLRVEHFTLERYQPHCPLDDDFHTIQDGIQQAHGVVFATPVWNFSIPAHLKNVIDRMGAFGLDTKTRSVGQFKGKPFYLIYTGGAPMIAWKALMHLTTQHVSEAIKYYGGVVLGKHFEPKCMVRQGVFGLVVDNRERSLARMRKRGEEFAHVVRDYHVRGRLPVRKELLMKFFTFAYRVGNRMMYPISQRQ
jgi:multimeric flavodoxin WrbA